VAPGTFAILAVTIGIYVLTRLSRPTFLEFVNLFAQGNLAVAEGDWYRIFTPVLLHANTLHVAFNMWALYQLGPAVERRTGLLSYTGLYLAAAGWGGAFAYRLGGAEDVLIGASGAIFGLFGLWLHSAYRLRDTAFGRNLLSSLGFTLLINAALPLLIPGISWQGHLGGLVAGIITGELWSRVRDPRTRALVPLGMALVAVLSVVF
jgi:rhomboid protease GluP